MKRLALAILLATVAWGCPDPTTGKIDPYLTARTVINQASIGVTLAEGIFNQWLFAQTDAEKAKKTQATFEKIKTSVLNGLQLALNGVAIAEQAKKDPNIADLMVAANDAWGNLRKFLEDLLAKPEDAALVTVATAPSSQPTTAKGGVNVKTSALVIKSPIDALPKKLY